MFGRPLVRQVEMHQNQQVAFVAHPANQEGKRHSLLEHLTNVGELAAGFAAKFEASELGRWAGRWHDIGKFNERFQKYLSDGEGGGGPDHKAAGALLALEHFSPLAFVIYGHHGGLPSLQQLKPWLSHKQRCSSVQESLRQAMAQGADLNPPALSAPSWLGGAGKEEAEFFLRMLFSALVDADFLDTEQHLCPENAAARRIPHPGMDELEKRFHHNFDRAIARRRRGACFARRMVLTKCLNAAEQSPGIFNLPIGPSSDRSIYALGFAVHHCSFRAAERIIVVVPSTVLKERIVEIYGCLTARQERLADQPDVLPLVGCPDFGQFSSLRARLAAENWDSRLVVTTAAHFFESLLSNLPSRCRKLHNVCRSVVILEGFQAIPLGIIEPITHILNELVAHYGVTLVFADEHCPPTEKTRLGAKNIPITNIIAPRFRSSFWQARIPFELDSKTTNWQLIADRMSKADQVLAVTNCKSDALRLIDALGSENTFHLSSLLCAAHRKYIISEIRNRLSCGLPCRVVGTPMAEDAFEGQFPLVFRLMAPLERLLLAAACCKRNRRSGEIGKLVILEPVDAREPAGAYSSATAVTRNLLRQSGTAIDNYDTFQIYCQTLFEEIEHDRKGLQGLRRAFDFPAVARQFRFLEGDADPLIVPYTPPGRKIAPAKGLMSRLQEGGPNKEILRLLTGYTVPVYRHTLERWANEDKAELIVAGLWAWKGPYDQLRGIGADYHNLDLPED